MCAACYGALLIDGEPLDKTALVPFIHVLIVVHYMQGVSMFALMICSVPTGTGRVTVWPVIISMQCVCVCVWGGQEIAPFKLAGDVANLILASFPDSRAWAISIKYGPLH